MSLGHDSSSSLLSNNIDTSSSDNDENDLLNISEDLVKVRQQKNAETSVITELYDLLPENINLKLHQDLKTGCGGQLWPAGMVLSRYLLRTKPEAIKTGSM